jgi:erythromycin esterase
MDRIGNSQYVLLGESSHGTSEFYRWRTEISKRLIKEKGFSFIAVEGDWPDCFRINMHVKGFSDPRQSTYNVIHSFNRWPTWMWANKEVIDLIEWLKTYNDGIEDNDQNKVGFYGLDLYSLWESMDAIIQYLRKTDPSSLRDAIEAYNCFEPYNKDVERYAHAAAFVKENCEEEVIEMLVSLQARNNLYGERQKGSREEKEEFFDLEQNAITAKEAERYYRTMMRGDVNSWNLRDTHMMDTLERLMDFHSPQISNNGQSKCIVWAHNTHIGDARFTDMAQTGMINLGQLVRERKGTGNSALIGFSTYQGTVIAAKDWGTKMTIMDVPPAKEGSWDDFLHSINNKSNGIGNDKLIVFNKEDNIDKLIPKGVSIDNQDNDEFHQSKGQRAIGVVYNPKYEKYGNYVPTVLSLRYDALLFVDRTHALSPLHMTPEESRDLPETFPTGV